MKMCIITDSLLNETVASQTIVSAAPSAEPTTNTISWTQIFRKPLKPRLPRKIVTSAKSNLNKYWHKFEELLANDAITPDNVPFAARSSTRTSYRLMPPMLSALRRNRAARSAGVAAATAPYHYYQPAEQAPPSPPASPIYTSAPTTALFGNDGDEYTVERRNNIADEIACLMSKRFTVEKNLARSSMYKHFTDESLYHGVNLNAPAPNTAAPATRDCLCAALDFGGDSDSEQQQYYDSAAKYPFTHRNLSLSFEDKENLENEAMEVYTNLGYETSF